MFEASYYIDKVAAQITTIVETIVPTTYAQSFTDLVSDSENITQFQILCILVFWLILNLCLIRTAWGYYSSDVESILTSSQGRSQSFQERPRRETENEHMKKD